MAIPGEGNLIERTESIAQIAFELIEMEKTREIDNCIEEYKQSSQSIRNGIATVVITIVTALLAFSSSGLLQLSMTEKSQIIQSVFAVLVIGGILYFLNIIFNQQAFRKLLEINDSYLTSLSMLKGMKGNVSTLSMGGPKLLPALGNFGLYLQLLSCERSEIIDAYEKAISSTLLYFYRQRLKKSNDMRITFLNAAIELYEEAKPVLLGDKKLVEYDTFVFTFLGKKPLLKLYEELINKPRKQPSTSKEHTA